MNIKHLWNVNNRGYTEKLEEKPVPLSLVHHKSHMSHVSRLTAWILIQKALTSIPDKVPNYFDSHSFIFQN
jgi:hypothetical protein